MLSTQHTFCKNLLLLQTEKQVQEDLSTYVITQIECDVPLLRLGYPTVRNPFRNTTFTSANGFRNSSDHRKKSS